ncbi:MAG: outer membrane beta-barrel family protein [Thermoflexibacter sp.]
MRTLTAIFSLLLVASYSFAQSISGTVLDENAKPLPFANVLLLKSTDSSMVKGAVSDANTGKYSFEKIASGKYLVSVRVVGYQTYFSQPFEFSGVDVELETVRLNLATTQLKEVSVSAAKSMIEVKNNAIVLNVESSPILSSGTALDVLSKAPGVNVDQDGKISLKGRPNVSVMIDGKLTYLSADEVSRLLQNTPATNIESIEVMQNPSAKYDAAGNAGIINIKMKRDKTLGANGSLNLNTGYGRFEKYGAGGTLNYRQKKFNAFGNYNYNYNKRFQELDFYRTVPLRDELTIFQQNNDMINWRDNHSFRAGIDYIVSPKTTIGAMVNGNFGSWNGNNDNRTRLSGLNPNPYDKMATSVDIGDKWNNIAANFNVKQKVGKGELTFDADYSHWKRDGNQLLTNIFSNGETQNVINPLYVKMKTDANIDIKAFKADYSIGLKNNLNLEVGAKSSWVVTDNNLGFMTKQDADWANDPQRSNTFEYTENINAAYVNLSKQFSKTFSVQAGLRGEHTNSDGYSATMNQRNKRDYFNLFPSISASYVVGKNHNFSLSLSRRIDRPDYQSLNPFIYFLDKYNYQKGNPFLNPQFTNSYSLTYSFKNAATASLSYNKTKNAMTQIVEQDNVSQSTFATMANLNDFQSYSLTLSSPIPVQKWWMANVNFTGVYNQIKSPFTDGTFIDNSQFSVIGNITNTFSLTKATKLEITGFYQSAMIYGIFNFSEQYQIDMGLSHSLMGGKMRLRASVTDVFNTRNNRMLISQGTLNSNIYNKWETRVARLTLTYNFGRNEIKPARQRKTSIDDVQRRVGGNN